MREGGAGTQPNYFPVTAGLDPVIHARRYPAFFATMNTALFLPGCH